MPKFHIKKEKEGRPMILKNKHGLNGQATTGVVISMASLKNLLSINSRFIEMAERKKNGLPIDTFTLNENSREYELHHLTNTDIELFIILNKICNTRGFIRDLEGNFKHQIYQKICEYYEVPMSASQFYISYEKGKLHNIFTEEKTATGEYIFRLNHVYNEEEDKAYYYQVISPVVFTKEFNNLSLAAKKWFLQAAVQQNNNQSLTNNITSLYKSLLKGYPHQIREVINEVTQKMGDYDPLFSRAEMTKNARGQYDKVYFSVNVDYIIKDKLEFRDTLSIPARYPRKARFIEKVLSELGIGEMSERINTLVQKLKHFGYRFIRFVLKQLKDFFKRNGHFPADLALFLTKETRFVKFGEIMELAGETNLTSYIDVNDDNRTFEFCGKFFNFNSKQIYQMFKSIQPVIEDKFTKPFEPEPFMYRNDNYLSMYVQGLTAVRLQAMRCKVDPDQYRQLEEKAFDVCIEYQNLENNNQIICEWLLAEIEKLPSVNRVLDLPNDLKLEDFIFNQFHDEIHHAA